MQQTQQSPSESPVDATLRRLEARLERASAVAERLFADAASEATAAAIRLGERRQPGAGSASGAGGAPAQGWQSHSGEEESPAAADLAALTVLWRQIRDLLPGELRQRLHEALHELLLALRALIDWYVERLEHRRTEPVLVEDIPID